MKPVFADTSYFVALAGPNDALHARAVNLSANLLPRIVTTEYVFVEAGGLLCDRRDRMALVNLVRDLLSEPGVQIVSASAALFRAGFDLFAARPDKEWSLTDCTSFVVMQHEGITEALTGDHHFEQAGFIALLK